MNIKIGEEDMHSFPEASEQTDVLNIETFVNAGTVKRTTVPQFEWILRANNPYHPFRDEDQFQVAKWLHELPLPKAESFFQLKLDKPSGVAFESMDHFRTHLEGLARPRMTWRTMPIIPRSGTTNSFLRLYYRDPITAVQSLLDRPSLARSMSYTPQRIYNRKPESGRVYSEIWTGEWAWDEQLSLPPDSTLIPVLLACDDKNPITNDQEQAIAYPVYLSIGNIHSSVRNNPSSNAWILIAFIPIAAFSEPRSLRMALDGRLFHQCIKIILEPLKSVGKHGMMLEDSIGDVRHCYTRIAAFLCHRVEQATIVAAPYLSSPFTTASYKQLGDAAPHPPRTKDWILDTIAKVQLEADPDDIEAYKDAALKLNLNAIDEPFWVDQPGFKPDLVICPDITRGLSRFWRDHVLRWVQHLVGSEELDRRIGCIQPLVGSRHFERGISYMSSWSRHDEREIQRVLMAAIGDAPGVGDNLGAVRCLRVFHDFLYLAQYCKHTEATLGYLRNSLHEFHSLKGVFIETGARKGYNGAPLSHFNLERVAELHEYSRHIPQMGCSPQYSTEVIDLCREVVSTAAFKNAIDADPFPGMLAHLDRCAAIRLVEELGAWHVDRTRDLAQDSLSVSLNFAPSIESAAICPEGDQVRYTGRSERTSILLNIDPDQNRITLNDIMQTYRFRHPAFQMDLSTFIQKYEQEDASMIETASLRANVWYQCRVQRVSAHDDEQLYTKTIQALPPIITGTQFGLCNCVLIHENGDTDTIGIDGGRVVQVRMIFELEVPSTHLLYKVPLAYVYWFSRPMIPPNNGIDMYHVSYQRGPDTHRRAGIVEATSISRLVQLVPAYGPTVLPILSANNSMDICSKYYINSFMDEDIYQAIW